MYVKPRNIEEAMAALASGPLVILCGATDVFPAHAGKPLPTAVLDISGIAELRGISRQGSSIRIGAATTWSELIASPLPSAFDGLKAAAREVGSIQIQNRGTIAGNICNASPAADGIPPLLTLDARIELCSPHGKRTIPLEDFIVGYRRTAIAANEIVSAVIVPDALPGAQGAFVKLGARRYLVISILMAAALIEKDGGGGIVRATVAIGAASPVAVRLRELEHDLRRLAPGLSPSTIVRPSHMKSLSPIDDVRASAGYRLEAATAIVGEALDQAWKSGSHD